MPRRRDVLTGGMPSMLAMPTVARAKRDRTLKFVPFLPLALLDPVWTSARSTHLLAHAVFDTLYGSHDSYAAHPQMVEGHAVEKDGTLWTLRLRDGLKFHDGTPVLALDAVASIRRWGVRDGYGQALRCDGRTHRARRPDAALSPQSAVSPSSRSFGGRITSRALRDAGASGKHRSISEGLRVGRQRAISISAW